MADNEHSAEEVHQGIDDVIVLTRSIDEKTQALAEAKNTVKTIRAELKEMTCERERLLHDLGDGQASLFDSPKPRDAGDNAWRQDKLAEALPGLPPAIMQHLRAANIYTMGELAEFSASQRLLADIPGIGPANSGKIEEATIRYWERRAKP